jgi:glycerol-3-phosphate dehydrogenase (NAD(P)+)
MRFPEFHAKVHRDGSVGVFRPPKGIAMGLRCTVLGGGSWGTALAIQLARRGHDVELWDRNADRCEQMNATRRNPRYLKSVDWPDNLRATPYLAETVGAAELVVPVVPSHALRDLMRRASADLPPDAVICCATKGIEDESLLTMADVIRQEVPAALHEGITVLSGPSFALEVAMGLPTAVAIAGASDPAHVAAEAFHSDTFRAYHTEDVVGVCVGGAVKNVLAIACGVIDGIGLGHNARAGMITRGLNEAGRLAVALGANPLTLMGLAGMGDLVLTCTGDLSRNRRVGMALGRGQQLPEILAELGEVAEGVHTARSAWKLAQKTGVEMPITEQVHAVLFENKPVAAGVSDLLGRARRAERDT